MVIGGTDGGVGVEEGEEVAEVTLTMMEMLRAMATMAMPILVIMLHKGVISWLAVCASLPPMSTVACLSCCCSSSCCCTARICHQLMQD